jgi:hypothetical protein
VFGLFNLCGDIAELLMDNHKILIRRIVVPDSRLRKKHSGIRVVPMTEIPMPDDYGARPHAPQEEKGCCERCCTCSIQVVCAIVLIVLLIFLILFTEVLWLFG